MGQAVLRATEAKRVSQAQLPPFLGLSWLVLLPLLPHHSLEVPWSALALGVWPPGLLGLQEACPV